MKKLFVIAAVLMLTAQLFSQDNAAQVQTLRVLMIGNSFSQSVLPFLPPIVEADPSVNLIIRNAYIGGCSIERHLKEYDTTAKNPEHRPYSTNLPIEGVKGNKVSLQECLKADKYDIVTIQQASYYSWRIDSYGEDAKRLISIVREFQPKAEIVAHQTWAYRADSKNLLPGGNFKINQLEMHNHITECYKMLQKEYGLRVIPVGNAVQIFRTKTDKPYTAADVPKTPLKYTHPELPPAPNDVVGTAYWAKDKTTDEFKLRIDSNHLNKRGQYLQACVWYMFLFNKKADDVKFIPSNFDEKDAKFLAKCAEEAIATWNDKNDK